MDGFMINVELRDIPVSKSFGPFDTKSKAEEVLQTLAGREDVKSAHIEHRASSKKEATA